MKMGNKSYAASNDGRNEEKPEINSSNKRDSSAQYRKQYSFSIHLMRPPTKYP